MEYPSEIIRNLINRLITIPGIGQRSAIRIALSLLRQNKEDVEELALAIQRLKRDIQYCHKCKNISDKEICNICSDDKRDHKTICIVEDIRDVIAIENTQQYKGLYYVLGGVISPSEGVGPGDLPIQLLLNRLEQEGTVEIIFALNATVEGDTTMFYIARQVDEKKTRISVLSRGISIGGELEFADEVTLGRSISSRVDYKL